MTASPRFFLLSSPTSTPDLILPALHGDKQAVAALVDQLTPAIQKAVASTLWRRAPARANGAVVEDLVQDVFYSLFENGGRALRAFTPERGTSLESFVSMLAHNLVISTLRTQKTNPWRDEAADEQLFERLSDQAPGPDRLAEDRELFAAVVDRIAAELSPRGLELFYRLFVWSQSPEEVGQDFSMTPDAVYKWRSRIGQLARKIGEEIQGNVSETLRSSRNR